MTDRPPPTRRDLLRMGASALLLPRPGPDDRSPGGDLAPLDNLMAGLLRVSGVPGGSLAIARGDRLVYARGFGRADRDRDETVGRDALFRIASLSKPITAAAVLSLVDRGKIRLDDRIFEVLDLGSQVGKDRTLDPRWREVTILQLLRHQGGWDRTEGGDPMGVYARKAWQAGPDPAARVGAIVRAMLGRPLAFVPGTKFVYSNFGYALLGRAIARASGRFYEDFVREAILAPAGANGMRLGRTLWIDRAPGEVRYHDGNRVGPAACGPIPGLPVPRPYGVFCLEAMDANGGWIASAPDLVRFAAAIDPDGPRAAMSASGFRATVDRPGGLAGHSADGEPKPAYYGCGWLARRHAPTGRFTLWHAGALDGTSTLLIRRHDGFSIAALFNARVDGLGKDVSATIEPLLHRAMARVRAWPEGEPLRSG